MTAACPSSWLLYLIVSCVHVGTYVRKWLFTFTTWKNESESICVKHMIMCMCVRVCASMHERSVCFTVCLTALSVSVCADVCVRMYACMMEGVEELGLGILDQHHSDWEDPVLLSWPHM